MSGASERDRDCGGHIVAHLASRREWEWVDALVAVVVVIVVVLGDVVLDSCQLFTQVFSV